MAIASGCALRPSCSSCNPPWIGGSDEKDSVRFRRYRRARGGWLRQCRRSRPAAGVQSPADGRAGSRVQLDRLLRRCPRRLGPSALPSPPLGAARLGGAGGRRATVRSVPATAAARQRRLSAESSQLRLPCLHHSPYPKKDFEADASVPDIGLRFRCYRRKLLTDLLTNCGALRRRRWTSRHERPTNGLLSGTARTGRHGPSWSASDLQPT